MGDISMPPRAGDLLHEDALGPAHRIVRRLIATTTTAAVQFVRPLRVRGRRIAKGSDLLRRTTLRQLLTWLPPLAHRAPNLTVVLVDRDGEVKRRQKVIEYCDGLAGAFVVSVAVEAFEAWLLLAASGAPEHPEQLSAQGAKHKLNDLLGPMTPEAARDHRVALAERAPLSGAAALVELEKELTTIVPRLLAG